MRRWTKLCAVLFGCALAALPAQATDDQSERLQLARQMISLNGMALEIAQLPAHVQVVGLDWECVQPDDATALNAWTEASKRTFVASEFTERWIAAYAAEFTASELVQLNTILAQAAMQKIIQLTNEDSTNQDELGSAPRLTRNLLERIERERILRDIIWQDDAVDQYVDWLVDISISCSLSRIAMGLEPPLANTAAVVVGRGMLRQDYRWQALGDIQSQYEKRFETMTTEEMLELRHLQSQAVWQRSVDLNRRTLGQLTRAAAIAMGEDVATTLRKTTR